MTINGQQVAADAYDEILNPSTGESVGFAPQATAQQLDDAVGAAQAAFEKWRHTSDDERKAACHRIGDILEANAGDLAVLLTKEQGKPLAGMGSNFELGGCVGWTRYTAEQSLEVKVLQDNEGGRIEQHRVPIGVVGSITPWNWPLMIAIWHVIPAIRTGNTVVTKPSPYTPLSTLKMIELISEAVPPGVLNVVSGGNELGAGISQHPGIGKLIFTGSIPTGKKVMASASDTLKPVTLELGGNDPGIVLPDADPAAMAEGMFWGSFINSGQTCGALKRLYVHDSIYDATCEALTAYAGNVPMGDGMDENNVLGPLQNEMQFNKVVDLVNDAKANGARILCGGEPTGQGYFYPITLVADIQDGARLVDEEQFGPVLPIIRYTDLDDAIARANGLDYGLDASVWSTNKEAAAAVAARLEAGTVFINKHAEIAPHVPFGGIKCSGIGVEFGEEGLEAYTHIKIVNAAA
ncbi:MAG: aldehyde dehydrogenase family protein [Pseudomonadota bacterium]